MNDCGRTKTLLMLAADGELAHEESAWLEQHLQSCPACHREQLRFGELDGALGLYGDQLSRQSPARVAAPRGQVRKLIEWIPQLAAALAALLFLGLILFHTSSPGNPSVAIEESFVPIPYVQPLGEYETATVMRIEMPVAALIAYGFKVDASDPAAVVKADVLVGEDGRAHAVRILSGLVLN